jgi:hypothetical protein
MRYVKDSMSSLLQIKQITLNPVSQKGCADDHSMHCGTIQTDKIVSLDKQEGKFSNVLALDKVKQVLFLLSCIYYFITLALKITHD